MCLVSAVINLQKEEQQQKQSRTLRKIDVAKIQDANQDIKQVKDIVISKASLTSPQKPNDKTIDRSKLKITSKTVLVRSTAENMPSSHEQVLL